ncbi:hypothetical protein CIPAW_15G111500 [Carya illinoinensis]|uniref:Uncharacterized protein n=1 Tax=Carya illinoinensis TaxID=32201 RepID=A0A8T1NEE3_CARIL|nr:hypothetical protein CIPAW_15G111500 [Carya illinoinensis]
MTNGVITPFSQRNSQISLLGLFTKIWQSNLTLCNLL